MIKLENTSKTYQATSIETLALRDISLEIARGEFVSIMGPSGCGKSTLLNLIGLLDRPTSGTVSIDGQLIETYKDKELARLRNHKIGFVFQEYHLIPDLTVVDNVEIPLLYRPGSASERRKLALAALEKVGLGARVKHYPTQLSGGQQQRVAIVRALAMEPRLMLLDEITSALDPELVAEVLNIVRDLARDGMTMMLATHEMHFAKEVSSKVCFLHEGVILEEGPPEVIFEDPTEERTQAFLKRIIDAGRL